MRRTLARLELCCSRQPDRVRDGRDLRRLPARGAGSADRTRPRHLAAGGSLPPRPGRPCRECAGGGMACIRGSHHRLAARVARTAGGACVSGVGGAARARDDRRRRRFLPARRTAISPRLARIQGCESGARPDVPGLRFVESLCMSSTDPQRIVIPRSAPARRLLLAGRVETIVAVSALATIALHVLDDNFIEPERGVGAGSHLLSGLLPLAALVWLGTRYGRSRPGARATGVLLAGMLGVVAGIGEAAYYTLETGAAGDDFTGFLALAGGLVLFGVGASTLWRSRKTTGNVLRRSLRRVLLVLLT